MITSKQKRLLNYFLFIGLLSFVSCYEDVEGCLDIQAVNYNAAADAECESCCSYPQLEFNDMTRFDTLSFSRNTKYAIGGPDTLVIHDIYLLLSDFSLQGENQEYSVTDMHAYDGSLDEIDDLVFVDFTSSTSNIGTLIANDSILTMSFQVGLLDAIDDKDNDFSNLAEVETLIDSMYYDASDRLEFFRLDFSSLLGQDTTHYLVNVSGQNNVFSETFDFNTNIDRGENIVISLDIDIFKLFLGIDFNSMSSDLIREAIENNLRSQLFK